MDVVRSDRLGPKKTQKMRTFFCRNSSWNFLSRKIETSICFDLFYSVDIYIVFKTTCVFAEVSYIPEKVVVRPGENVTVYCVFNDHNFNASTALWILNFNQQLDHSQYHLVNQWVSCNWPSLPGSLTINSMMWSRMQCNLGDLVFLKTGQSGHNPSLGDWDVRPAAVYPEVDHPLQPDLRGRWAQQNQSRGKSEVLFFCFDGKKTGKRVETREPRSRGAIEGDTKVWLFVSGASIDISCETNGDIDAMGCRWNSTQWMNPTFRSRWGLLVAHGIEANNTIRADLTFTRVSKQEVFGVLCDTVQ